VSYDLAVFTSERPQLPGDPGGLCEVDGPLEAQDEDAPPQVVAALLSVGWTVELSLPAAATKRDVTAAARFARAVAESGRGVVYDPQEDRITWPRNPARLRKVETSREGRADDLAIQLHWLFARRLTSADAHTLLAVLSDAMPEAVPVRFGDYEPMQGRLERDGAEAFAAFWDGGDMAFWRGAKPFDWGFVFLERGRGAALPPDQRPPLGPDELELDFLSGVCDDARWLAAIERLLVHVADALGAFFAYAHHEKQKVERHADWQGLPPEPLWLAWLGDAYREAAGAGPLIRNADRPDDFKVLGRSPPPWPRELVRPASVIPVDPTGYQDVDALQ
jgi:hypothetical protein